uniref:Uncharacterized protein n=1 Tax=viral metagenome TaxID=1070528 RepID=A0A6C0IG01_9ZZZZ
MAKNNKSKKSSIYNKIGKNTTNLAVNSVPVIEKGVSTVYGTLATGFDIGLEGAKNVAKGVNKYTKYNKSKKNSSKRRNKKTRRTNRR